MSIDIPILPPGAGQKAFDEAESAVRDCIMRLHHQMRCPPLAIHCHERQDSMKLIAHIGRYTAAIFIAYGLIPARHGDLSGRALGRAGSPAHLREISFVPGSK